MKLIKTKSFELAVNEVGGKNAEKLALLLPGRLDTKDYYNFVSHQKFLANKGFFTVALDPPGTWESPGDIGLFTTTNYVKAVNELIEFYGNKPTLLLGHSRGGTVVMLTAVSNPNVKGFVTVNSGFGAPTPASPEAIKQGYNLEYRDLPPGIERTKEKKAFKMSLDYFSDGQKYNALTLLKGYTKPKLFFYAKKDEFMTPEEFMEGYNLVSDPKEKYELNCDHDYRLYPEMIEEVNKVVGKFLDNYFNSFPQTFAEAIIYFAFGDEPVTCKSSVPLPNAPWGLLSPHSYTKCSSISAAPPLP